MKTKKRRGYCQGGWVPILTRFGYDKRVADGRWGRLIGKHTGIG
jgi:hypothetical protein